MNGHTLLHDATLLVISLCILLPLAALLVASREVPTELWATAGAILGYWMRGGVNGGLARMRPNGGP